MSLYKGTVMEDQPRANWKAIYAECRKYKDKGFIVEVREYDYDKELSNQQIRWFKGVLLRNLSKDTGDSKQWWETRLKLLVMPDDFKVIEVKTDEHVYNFIPSISSLTAKKMNEFIEGCVSHLRDEEIYGDRFLWVTLPDPELRR
jgi:hypothetical protein